MDTQKLRHLLALEQHGTFQRAADAVRLTQPAFSRSLRALEGEIGVPLVERRGRGSVLTDAGRLLVERARALVRQETEAYRALQLLQDGELGSVRVGVAAGPQAVGLAGFTRELARRRPRVRVEVVLGATVELCRKLHDEALDVVAGDADVLAGDAELETEVLPPFNHGVFCRPGHPLLAEPVVTPELVMRYQVAAFPWSDRVSRETVERVGPAFDPQRLVTLLASDPQLLLGLARESDTLLVCNAAITAADVADGTLCELVVPPVRTMQLRNAIARVRGRALTPTLDLFYQAMRDGTTQAHALIRAAEAREARPAS